MDPLLKGYFNKFLNSFELVKPQDAAIDDSNKMSSLYERFINYTIFSADEPAVFSANNELLDFVGPGGESDAKIDGFGIRVNGHLIRDKEDIAEIIKINGKIEIEFVVIQTKMRPHFDTTEFLSFGYMIRNFFSNDPPKINEHLQEIYALKETIYSDTDIISALKANPSLKIYYVTTGQFIEDDHFEHAKKDILRSFIDDQRGDYFENVEIEVIDARKTRNKVDLLEYKHTVVINIQKSMNLTVGNNDRVKKAVSFTCSAHEFLKLLCTEDGNLRRTLFNDNVRDYLGTGNINREIEHTMINEPELFLLCNNGITIVSSNFEPIKDDLVRITNPQIVNGCQTSNTLYKLKDQIDKNKLLLSIRVICTDDNEVSNKVVRSTNRQNQVLEEAFETTKPFHHEIEKMFALTNDPVQLFYERRARQYDWNLKIKKSHIVNLRCLTHVFVASFIEQPHVIHRHEAILIKEFTKNSRRMFNPEHSPKVYYVCGLLYYRVEEAFKNNTQFKKYSKLRGHIYYLIRYLSSFQVPVLKESSKDFQKFISKLTKILQDPNIFQEYLVKATGILDKTLEYWIQHGNSQYGYKDNAEFTKLLRDQIAQDYNLPNNSSHHVKETSRMYKGRILSFKFSKQGLWYAFIIPENGQTNLYFDSRNFDGETRKLYPKAEVEYTLRTNSKGELQVDRVYVI